MESNIWNKNIILKKTLEYSRYIMIVFISLYIGVILYFAAKSPNGFISKPFTIITLIFIPVFILSYFYISEIFLNHKLLTSMIILGIVGFIGIVLYFYLSSPRKNIMTQAISYMSIIIVFLLFIFGLTIFYNMFMNTTYENESYTLETFGQEYIFNKIVNNKQTTITKQQIDNYKKKCKDKLKYGIIKTYTMVDFLLAIIKNKTNININIDLVNSKESLFDIYYTYIKFNYNI
jgi:hypothetical protein